MHGTVVVQAASTPSQGGGGSGSGSTSGSSGSAGSTATGTTATAATVPTGPSLPSTGLNLPAMILAAATLAAVGGVLRRRSGT